MRSSAVVTFALPWLLLAGTAALHAGEATQRLDWKLEDFQPLTELPWSANMKEPMAEVLTAIFREPDPQIRYPVLAYYLRKIPVAQLGPAFDQCLAMEGRHVPEDLIHLLLRIWASRDPGACWVKTRSLFQLVGIEHGWLVYDGWKSRPGITVRNAKAITASPFWIESGDCLLGFPLGVAASSLPEAERVKLLRAFADTWFTEFKTWPVAGRAGSEPAYQDDTGAWIPYAFTISSETLNYYSSPPPFPTGVVEIGLRRWLKAEPGAALEILKKRDELIAPTDDTIGKIRRDGPSVEWLMIWRELDLPAMTGWVESLDSSKKRPDWSGRGMLMSWVDEPTRARWLTQAGKADESALEYFISEWARWNPQRAVKAALATGESSVVDRALEAAAYGPFFQVTNTWHSGMGFVRDFDASTLYKSAGIDIPPEWGDEIMAGWGDINVGETARYGIDFITKAEYAPREKLIGFLSGKHDDLADTGDVVDRTFCALRVWAVTKPDEMRAWIATLKDKEMRSALTWLLENPWGAGPEE